MSRKPRWQQEDPRFREESKRYAQPVPSRDLLLAKLAETQRALGFEVGDTFKDRLGDLPAAGFLATGPARSVCTWMVKRDTHLASSVICTAEGKQTAREACRPLLAKLHWRTPRPNDR